MAVYPNLSYSAQGLSVTLTDKSLGTIDSRTWKFGDGTEVTSAEDDPKLEVTHEYMEAGYKEITLELQEKVEEGEDVPDPVKLVISLKLSDGAITTTKPVVASVWDRIPSSLQNVALTYSDVWLTVNHWRVYLAPLFSPAIGENEPEEVWDLNQLQLLEEIVFWDILNTKVQGYLLGMVGLNPVGSGSQSGTTETTGTGGSISGQTRGSLKRVVTGPAEAEWYTVSESSKTTATTEDYNKQLSIVASPGGLLSQIGAKVCLFARRLQVQLSLCPDLPKPVFAPRVFKNR